MTIRRTDRDVQYDERTGRTRPVSEMPAGARTDPATRTDPARTDTMRGGAAQAAAAPAYPPGREPGLAEASGRASLADRVTGGPVWSGFLIGFATWVVLTLGLIALGLNGIRGGGETVNASEWWWSLGAGLIALFVGGLVAGASSRWRTSGAGALQGLTVWALIFLALLVLGALGAGLGFGAFSDVVNVNPGNATDVPATAIDTAEDAAGVAFLLLLATAAAAVIGGIIGSRMKASPQQDGSPRPAGAGRS